MSKELLFGREAKEALETCNGDVLEAIIYLEDKIKKDANEQMEKYSENKNETRNN